MIMQPFLVTGLMFARISITILLIRLFPTKTQLGRFLIDITIVNYISTVLPLVIFTCIPAQAHWDKSLHGH